MAQQPLNPSQSDAMQKLVYQLVRGILLRLVEDMPVEQIDDLFSHDIGDPQLVVKLSKHFDGRHQALAGRSKTPAAPVQRPVSGDGTQRRIPMAGAQKEAAQLMQTIRAQKRGAPDELGR